MSPTLLGRYVSNSSCIRRSYLTYPFPSTLINVRPLSTRIARSKTVLVQLTKNVPKLGVRGDIVAVKGGRMRNTLYPYSMAQYLRPGMDSFLTANKLAIPVGPNYRRLLKKLEPDPVRMEFKELFEKTRKRLIKEEKSRPSTGAREAVLFQIDRYQKQIKKDNKWSKLEKEELLKFLGIQAMSWGTLSDDLGSRSVSREKEKMLLETWGKFTEGMEVRQPQGKGNSGKQGKNKKVTKEVELEGESSTSRTIVDADVKIHKDEIETPIGTDTAAEQTVLHEEAAVKETKVSQSDDAIEDLEQRKIRQ